MIVDIFREGGACQPQDDDVEDVHALDALHAGRGGGEEGGDCRVTGGSKGAGRKDWIIKMHWKY